MIPKKLPVGTTVRVEPTSLPDFTAHELQAYAGLATYHKQVRHQNGKVTVYVSYFEQKHTHIALGEHYGLPIAWIHCLEPVIYEDPC